MAREVTFPESALEILRRTKWNPDAIMSYDGMSGAFNWSDEFPTEAINACFAVNNWAFRFVLGYRASLIMGKPRDDLRGAWDQLAVECPDWPGFRLERRSAELKPKLEAENIRFSAELDALCSAGRDRDR